jgi:hypothetical protein
MKLMEKRVHVERSSSCSNLGICGCFRAAAAVGQRKLVKGWGEIEFLVPFNDLPRTIRL